MRSSYDHIRTERLIVMRDTDEKSGGIHSVFISSLCHELRELRVNIKNRLGDAAYVYLEPDLSHPDISPDCGLAIADDLIRKVRESSVVICILGGSRHGTRINMEGIPSHVSFFEVEIFQAALLQKPIHILVRHDFEPETRLESVLRMLAHAFPQLASLPRRTEQEILSEACRIADHAMRPKPSRSMFRLQLPIRRWVQALYGERARLPDSAILFLNGAVDRTRTCPRVDFLRHLADSVERQQNEEHRLSRIWIGLRELMTIEHEALRDPELLGYWNQLLGQWAEAGAWYGLHGHTPLGALAALNSQSLIRKHLVQLSSREKTTSDTSFPGGPLASSKYSIAKRLYIKQDRESLFNEALDNIQRVLQDEGVSRPESG